MKIGLGDWMGLMQALRDGLVTDMDALYWIGRALLVKHEARFDLYDQVYAQTFKGIASIRPEIEKLLDWLKDPKNRTNAEGLEKLPLDELKRLFEERLKEQKERHDGGNRWIGTGGTSPFGSGGSNPAGIRIGGGGGRSAVQVAEERRYKDYRNDLALDDRQLAVALKRLRKLSRKDQALELDVEESIDKTCRNAGELELEFKPPRKNQARVILMMDTGGSMDPFSELVEKLFSAASQLNHWRKFEAYAFHNCPYEKIYKNIATDKGTHTSELLRDRPTDTMLIMVGDAYMAPYELVERYGAISLTQQNAQPGIVWLHRLRSHFNNAVWLNPMPKQTWANGWTIQTIGSLFPMYPLSVDGLDEAITHLIRGTPPPIPELDQRWIR